MVIFRQPTLGLFILFFQSEAFSWEANPEPQNELKKNYPVHWLSTHKKLKRK